MNTTTHLAIACCAGKLVTYSLPFTRLLDCSNVILRPVTRSTPFWDPVHHPTRLDDIFYTFSPNVLSLTMSADHIFSKLCARGCPLAQLVLVLACIETLGPRFPLRSRRWGSHTYTWHKQNNVHILYSPVLV